MSDFFISDYHFNHENIRLPNYGDRPFQSMEEMNREMIIRWNNTIGPRDKVYVIGDFAFGPLEKKKLILQKLNGYKILIRGNHDENKEKMLGIGFDEVYDQLILEIAGEKVLLDHYPYRPSQEELDKMKSNPNGYKVKNLNRRPINKGGFLIHGHVHQEWLQKGKMINMSVEMWDYTPAPLSAIESLIKAGSNNLRIRVR
jgi:calcineurin-like phosphoesterase family protein